ncbi:type 4b pilus protein PilO2 [Bordetella sp. BOR01]|uniref:type 4b pilus protein PilO2 n=1 Tax=Bordetella sp. BOR01 TaxID=2854779 RepID=UPI001C4795F2|nr:type 4b pilus protein PilO2 [Bordetella sp. BOR01]MBV7482366.1 type 4b pilus protein PilO2 [Bordetella sp. BOR01]
MRATAMPDQLLLLDLDHGEGSLAFGLSWFALVGSHAPAMARARARRMRATHYVVGGQGAMAGGCARIAPRLRRPVHAAAQVFARYHPDGTAACIAPLPDGRWWLAAAQDGAVLARADALYADAEQAAVALQGLAAQYPSLRQHDGRQTLKALMTSADAATLMQPVGSRWSRMPLPVRAFISLVAIALAVPVAWRAWQPSARVAAPVASVTAEEAWQQASLEFRRQHTMHALPELGRVLASLHRLPLNVQGWLLRDARCQPASRAWSCSAAYVRVQADATNTAFAQALPAGWQLRFQPLDAAELAWMVPGNSTLLADVALPDATHVDGVLASALQRARPAFTQLTLGPAASAPIAAPRDPHGLPIAAPPDWPALRQRAVALQGPLRSLSLLADQSRLVVAWSSVVLRLAAGRVPATAVSALTAELQGTLYEQD